jgi:Arc/MetJ-type ribon-helix-helix transcriptional regulator
VYYKYTAECATIYFMATITIRTDKAVDEALDALTAGGKSRSDAVREAILLASRELTHARLRAEAEALRNDPDDVAASKRLAAEMDSIRAW